MYSVYVPIDSGHLERSGRETVVAALREAGVSRVFLTIGAQRADHAVRTEIFRTLGENIRYLRERGFTVGVWLWAFMLNDPMPFSHMTTLHGSENANEYCPADPDYRAFVADYIKDAAREKPDIILLDDDLRFGHQGGLCCLCPHHVADLSARLGEAIDPATFAEKAFTGGANRYRDAYMASMADSLRAYAKELRAAVDSVDPTIRMGQCACISTWDVEGTDSAEISLLLAGNTKPFLRTIGAPYWAESKGWDNRLADVIELTRIESLWAADRGIEVISEGDVFPRPRWMIPASYLECFDIALRAAHCNDGILKYMCDYNSSAVTYEPGYLAQHNAHRADYEKIAAAFAGKTACGVRIYEEQHKLRNYDLPEKYIGEEYIQNLLFAKAERFAMGLSLPVIYTGGGYGGIVFGESAKSLPDSALDLPLCIDLTAAEILTGRGIDVGLRAVGEKVSAWEESFPEYAEFTQVSYGEHAYRLTVDEKAVPGSYYGDAPTSYTYENGAGQRFFVFACRMDFTNEAFYRNYCRQRQVTKFFGLPVHCMGNPDLYLYCAENETERATLLINLSPDKILSPTLPRLRVAETVNTAVVAADETHTKLSVLYPYEYAIVIDKK